jgi:hypothetical protein
MSNSKNQFVFGNFDLNDLGISGVFENGTTTGMVFLNVDEADGLTGAIDDSASCEGVLASSTLFCNRVIAFIDLPEFLERMKEGYHSDRIISFATKFAEQGAKKIRISAAYRQMSSASNKF